MRVVLTLNHNEVDNELISLIKTLLDNNAEIVIKKESVILEEYDSSIPS